MTGSGKSNYIMGMKKITFEQMCDPDFRRAEQMKIKSGVVWVAFLELGGLVNVSKFAKRYFSKTHAWFSQRLNGYSVNGKPQKFSADDYAQIAASFRDMANKLNEYADAIDNASEE